MTLKAHRMGIMQRRLTIPRDNNFRLIGFGISNHETFQVACEHSHGAIIGSAFISILSQEGLLEDKIGKFLGSVRNGPSSDIRA